MSIYLYVYKKMFIYNTIKQKHNFDVNNSDTIYINLHTYIYTHTGCIIYHVSKPNLHTASTCNKCVSNQPKTKTENLNKCENSLKIVYFYSFQNCAPK